MNKCKDCQYFGAEFMATDDDDPEYRMDTISTGYHACNLIQHLKIHFHEEDPKCPKAYVVDGSDYYAAIKVREDFGCSEFVDKQV